MASTNTIAAPFTPAMTTPPPAKPSSSTPPSHSTPTPTASSSTPDDPNAQYEPLPCDEDDVDSNDLATQTPEILAQYAFAVSTIGTALQSKASAHLPRTGNERDDFLADHQTFMAEIGHTYKVRRIGGGDVNIYGLYKSVLQRGGLQSVIFKRAFKMVAKSLQLPKTCTSAAFILRCEYEKLLYAYEQQHVFNRDYTKSPPLVQSDRRKGMPLRALPYIPHNYPALPLATTAVETVVHENNDAVNNISIKVSTPTPIPLPPAQHPQTNVPNNAPATSQPITTSQLTTSVTSTPVPPTLASTSVLSTTPASSAMHQNLMQLSPSNMAAATRSKRHAAQALLNTAASSSLNEDDHSYPYLPT